MTKAGQSLKILLVQRKQVHCTNVQGHYGISLCGLSNGKQLQSFNGPMIWSMTICVLPGLTTKPQTHGMALLQAFNFLNGVSALDGYTGFSARVKGFGKDFVCQQADSGTSTSTQEVRGCCFRGLCVGKC